MSATRPDRPADAARRGPAGRRWARAVAVLVLAPLTLFAAPLPSAPAASTGGVDTPTDSAVTVAGPAGGVYGDDFSGLRVTVSQTRNLSNQGISITWTGGAPTWTDNIGITANYLQIMQCWGPDPDDADFRETCVQGFGNPGTGDVGVNTNRDTRQRIVEPVDPHETLPPAAKMVPFRAVTGERTTDGASCEDPCQFSHPEVTSALLPYFGPDNTNEIFQGFTAANGTGRVVFEVQNAVTQPYLGCGAPTGADGRSAPRRCWLVVVPRGRFGFSGDPICEPGQTQGCTRRLDPSPLQASTFRDKIAIPLEFEPLGGGCTLGAEERLTVGTDLVADAVRSWQPALCANGGATYGYSASSDDDAIRQVLSAFPGAPGMGFTADPAVPPPGGPVVLHAPVALSGAVIAFNIDVEVEDTADEETLSLRASAVRELKLTPRLVAKLLTQSYWSDVPGNSVNEHVKKNPRDLFQDPEFRQHNPRFAQFSRLAGLRTGLMLAQGNSAAYREVWKWILADPAARTWLAGTPDENRMVVNPHYRNLVNTGVPLDTFPKADPTEHLPASAPEPYGTQHLRPYLSSMEEAAQQTRRADPRSRTVWDGNRQPPGYVSGGGPRPVGFRAAMSITDAASAARYGLFTASLLNREGEFVAPTREGMLTAVDAMVPSQVDKSVLVVDPAKATPGAYPLTMVNYAAVNISTPDQAARDDYARFLRYAVGAGQTEGVRRGELPRGYVPLPHRLREQSMLAANAIERGPTPSPTPSATPTEDGTPAPTGTPDPGAPPVAPTPSGTPAPGNPVSQVTPGGPLGVARYALLAALLAGLVGGAAGPVLLHLSGRRRR